MWWLGRMTPWALSRDSWFCGKRINMRFLRPHCYTLSINLKPHPFLDSPRSSLRLSSSNWYLILLFLLSEVERFWINSALEPIEKELTTTQFRTFVIKIVEISFGAFKVYEVVTVDHCDKVSELI